MVAVAPLADVVEAAILMRGKLRGGECLRVDDEVPS